MDAEYHPVNDGPALIGKLTLWTDRLVRIDMESKRVTCSMADAGVMPVVPVAVGPSDKPGIIRLKEQLIRLNRQKETVHAEMADVGAVIIDKATLEIAVPGGPETGTFLSWMPGEPRIAYWRKLPDTTCERHPLRGVPHLGTAPALH